VFIVNRDRAEASGGFLDSDVRIEHMGDVQRFRVRCPDCDAYLTIDAATGELVSHKSADKAPAEGKDFETLLSEIDENKAQAEEVFQQEFAAMKDKDRLLEEKFREGLKRAHEEPVDKPPARPFDLD
jgi:hypothetical protein